jgi:hypothetical protein
MPAWSAGQALCGAGRHTAQLWVVEEPASSVPTHVAAVHVPASQGWPAMATGHASGSQIPHGAMVTGSTTGPGPEVHVARAQIPSNPWLQA